MEGEDAVVDSWMWWCTRGRANITHLLHKQLKKEIRSGNGDNNHKWGRTDRWVEDRHMDRQTETGQNRNIGYKNQMWQCPSDMMVLFTPPSTVSGREDAPIQWIHPVWPGWIQAIMRVSTGPSSLRFPETVQETGSSGGTGSKTHLEPSTEAQTRKTPKKENHLGLFCLEVLGSEVIRLLLTGKPPKERQTVAPGSHPWPVTLENSWETLTHSHSKGLSSLTIIKYHLGINYLFASVWVSVYLCVFVVFISTHWTLIAVSGLENVENESVAL